MFLVAILLVWAPASADVPVAKIALLLQNDGYPEAEPTNGAGADAASLATALEKAGFEVEVRRNLRRREMQASVAAFVAKAGANTVTLLYYRGIGIQVARRTYLVPVDASIWSEADVRRDGTSLDRLVAELGARGAAIKIAIVDAARPNPFERRFRAYAAGLAAPSAPRGLLAIFADALDHLAEPAKTPVSPFMTELVKQLDAGGDAEAVFARTRDAVAKASGGRQFPWTASTLAEPFVFGRPAGGGPVVAPPPAATASQAAPAAVASSPPAPKPAPPAATASQAASTAVAAPPPAPRPPAPPPTPPPQKPTPAPPAAPPPPKPGDTFADCRRCPEMAVLAGASFAMGSGTTPFDRPVHRVTLTAFAIGTAVVTRDEWALCVAAGACAARPKSGVAAGGDYPVVEVDWSDAQRYATFLAAKTGKRYRLPTEAEWEYAARGGTTTAFAWGDTPGEGHANCTDCGSKSGRAELVPVKRYPKNNFGLFDMGGNVAEWLQDCWTLTYRGAPTDGSAPAAERCTLRVVRGGSFETTAAYVKPTARFRAAADTRSPSLGFRVARDLD